MMMFFMHFTINEDYEPVPLKYSIPGPRQILKKLSPKDTKEMVSIMTPSFVVALVILSHCKQYISCY